MSDRTPEERERARWEREVRRARREGRPEPPPPAGLVADGTEGLFADLGRQEPAPAAEDGAGPPTQAWTPPFAGGDPAAPDSGPPTEAWTPPFAAAEEAHVPDPDSPTQPPFLDDGHDPHPSDEHEIPAGTRRGLPARLHLPHRPTRPLPPRAPGPPGSRRRTRGLTVGRIAAGIALLLVVFLGWFLVSLFQPFHGKASGSVDVRVPDGASARQVGDLLEKKGVVSSSFFFSLRATLSGDRSKLGSGTYHLQHDMSYADALKALTHPPAPPKLVDVRLLEGPSIRESAALVKQDGIAGSYISAARRKPPAGYHATGARTLEGFLFPATYPMKPGSTAKDLVSLQLAAFATRFRTLDLRYAHRHGLNAYDVVKIASMIEREAATEHDRPLVAAVIYNRLHAGMMLGIDATLRYYFQDWSGALKQSQLASPTRYNTRLHKGLPPTPIGNPGLAALQAAAHPAKVSYLYYVAQPGSCNQAFSTTYTKFLANKQRYDRARAKAHGSPTKCP